MKGYTRSQKREIGNAFPFADTVTFTVIDEIPVVKIEKKTTTILNYDAFKVWALQQLRRVGLYGTEIGDYKYNGVTQDGFEIHLSIQWEA